MMFLVEKVERHYIVSIPESATAQGQTIKDVVALLHLQDD